jgi:DeoR family transcriptional regulator, glycerol-3-phosphate regulon repressor
MCPVSVKPYTGCIFRQFDQVVNKNVEKCGLICFYVIIYWFKALAITYFPNFQMKNLKVRQRQAQIISSLRQHGSQSVMELAALVGVSEETIRRDAFALQETGEVVKLHGSITLPHDISEAGFERRMREASQAKIAIARAAADMVRDGDSLIIDTGTTTMFFARELRQRRNLTVITNCTEIARALAGVAGNSVHLAGGELEADSGGTYGPKTTDFIARFRVKHLFLSIGALDLDAGPMNATEREANFAIAALACASHRVILADSSKFGESAFVRVCDYSDIQVVVTEKSPQPEFFTTLKAAGTRLVIAS